MWPKRIETVFLFFLFLHTGPEPSVHDRTLPCFGSSPHQGAGTWAERSRPIRMTSPPWVRDALLLGAAGGWRCGCALLMRNTCVLK